MTNVALHTEYRENYIFTSYISMLLAIEGILSIFDDKAKSLE